MDYTADRLALEMAFHGVPLPWLKKAHTLALESEGVHGLLELWYESETPEDRVACIVAIQELLEDFRPRSEEERAFQQEEFKEQLREWGCTSVFSLESPPSYRLNAIAVDYGQVEMRGGLTEEEKASLRRPRVRSQEEPLFLFKPLGDSDHPYPYQVRRYMVRVEGESFRRSFALGRVRVLDDALLPQPLKPHWATDQDSTTFWSKREAAEHLDAKHEEHAKAEDPL